MNAPAASYAFLSWARQGLGIRVQDAPAGQLRGTISVGVTIRGKRVDGSADATDSLTRNVALYGPGDVIGIDARAIVRTEPRHWITNFEPNYLAFIEFYDEDFPWRYTPAAPSADRKRLTPWVALVVLEEDEFKERAGGGERAPYIEVPHAHAKFPPPAQLWAWAHVHVDGALAGVNLDDTGALAARLEQTVRSNRDRAHSRLMCPRALKPNAGYHAFLIPTFETGRLAGLALDPAQSSSATKVAWEGGGPEPDAFPVYHRWYFRTGSVGDFEYLVRLLKPKPANPKVGTRDIDVQDAGAGFGGIDRPDLNGVLRLGGALRVPFDTLRQQDKDEFTRYDQWARPFPQPFQQRLADFVNLTTTYLESGASGDPVIAPPLYGRWHAAVTRVLDGAVGEADRERWLNELNLDPRYRAAAGFGTDVVQKHQEEYMEAAWQQVGQVLTGNQKIRYALMALAASRVWNSKVLEPMQAHRPERYLMLAAPVHRLVLAEGLTVQHRVQQSAVPAALLSKVVRQTLRPRARLARKLGFDAARHAGNLIDRVNRGEVVAAPPKQVPAALPTGDAIAERVRPSGFSPALLDLVRRNPWLAWLPLVLAIVFVLLLFAAGALGLLLGIALIAAAVWLRRSLAQAQRRERAADVLRSGGLTPAVIDALAPSPDFRIAEPGTAPPPSAGAADSEEARRFKAALRGAAQLEVAEAALPTSARSALDLQRIGAAVRDALRPERTIPAWTLAHVAIPARIRETMVDDFGEVMVYPEIDLPMYKPLTEISSELFLPNIQLIEHNSITLLETNQKFIEAYMVGLNHEFARELLWREYPTDQRGSYFRQFWDVSGFLAEPGADVEALRRRLRDITELHTWRAADKLGDHDNREAQGDKEEELVLVIRGELLKKYPNAIVYAHRAAWERVGDAPDGAIDRSRPRRLRELTPAEEANPPRAVVKTPLYDAAVEPDIYFFGFDLTAAKAKGGFVPDGQTEEDPGWFFVIKERPGEPRFGLDIAKDAPQAALHAWNELAWSDVMQPFVAGGFLQPGARTVTLTDPGGDPAASPLKRQYEEDRRFRWHAATHAAEVAYILYQVPVLMAVHAAEMLPSGA